MNGNGAGRKVPSAEADRVEAHALIRDAIAAFELDLTGLTVLTEAASGHFVWTPIIAALAGASRVLAVVANSTHGRATVIITHTTIEARRCRVRRRIVFAARNAATLTDADIVTNLGFVRPLDRGLLERLGPHAAVSLMCEPWELRRRDVDVAACRELGIAVLGTNEEDPRLKMFDHLPAIALELLTELRVAAEGAALVVLSSGKFAAALRTGLRAAGAHVDVFSPPLAPADDAFAAALAAADALVVADYPGVGPVLGTGAAYTAADLVALNPRIRLAHIAGDVRHEEVVAAGMPHAPAHFAPLGTMSVTAASLGPKPVIDLHCAGLKVGEALARARRNGLDARAAEQAVLASLPLALGFEHDGAGDGG